MSGNHQNFETVININGIRDNGINIIAVLAYKSLNGPSSFITLGFMLGLHYLFSEIKLCKSKKLYKVHACKYTQYGKNAC